MGSWEEGPKKRDEITECQKNGPLEALKYTTVGRGTKRGKDGKTRIKLQKRG